MSSYFKQNLREGEEPILLLRQHWASFLWPVCRTVICLGVTIPFLSYIFTYSWLTVAVIVWWAVSVVWLIISWFTWYFNLTLVTSQRIIDIEQRGMFLRRVREAPHAWIVEVTFEIKGLLATLFGYGNVYVNLGGDKKPICIEAVETPEIIKDKLSKVQEFAQRTETEQGLSARELIDYIQKVKNETPLPVRVKQSETKVKINGDGSGKT